ncbi:MAG: DUF1987 domain-containing protein [Pseudomonadota bacterium]|nr:DUF1987 domain-containing protein [Pseudomonadota bacterium]
MERLTLAASQLTPLVDFDYDRRMLVMRGESYPENAGEFYRPILASLRRYLSDAAQTGKLTVELQFAYVNSSSTRSLQQLLALLASASNVDVAVSWVVDPDDDSMAELGLDLLSDKPSLSYEIIHP